eukprot:TRINITY_DN7003_c0_g1_i2.p2 TRINITY_DN7003_c0_g1~~TRINITY_DN7003_c0_g1_i2.p2  ORF type:complete len:166 (-),score=38.55 TRINITY_DN7003_c0_g1_i2:370-867(-)
MSVYIGCDGRYKLGRLNVACYLREDSFDSEEFMRFFEGLIYWFEPEELAPELSLKSEEKVISVYADIWQLGVLMRRLTDFAAKPKIYYSEELVALQDTMLSPDPNKRPSAKEVLQYIMKKESLIGLNPASFDEITSPTKPGTDKSGSGKSFKEGWSEFVNGSSTK